MSGRTSHSSAQAVPSRSWACSTAWCTGVASRRRGGRASPAPRRAPGSTSAAWSRSRRPRPRAPRRSRSGPAAHVAAELAERAGHQRQPRGELAERAALGVPGTAGQARPSSCGQRLHHRHAVGAERRDVAGGPAELHPSSRGLSSASRSRWRGSGASQPATLSPKVVGGADLEARAADDRQVAQRPAAAARAVARSARRPSSSARTPRSCRTSAVSTMSCEVAPQCTNAPASPPTARAARPPAPAPAPRPRPCRARARRDRARSRRGRARSPAAASAGITPSAPSTRASAARPAPWRAPGPRRRAAPRPRRRRRAAEERRSRTG